uniref:flavin reductase family protein n=1 Tax=uncultured Sphingomonas sp. TaxID=158754 RepID=UPI0035CAF1D3
MPVNEAKKFLEPGPVIQISSLHDGRANIMTAGWHQILEFTPSLVSCLISSGNHNFEMIRQSRECVINVPTKACTDTVVSIGNTSGADTDKFDKFGLTRVDSSSVATPSIGECYANLECRPHDDALVERYNLFIFEVVAIQALARHIIHRHCTIVAMVNSCYRVRRFPVATFSGPECSERSAGLT